jgi:hypothetical protein
VLEGKSHESRLEDKALRKFNGGGKKPRRDAQAFFDLTKGQHVATLALKEKRQLAWKRNHTLR